jgi:hypothetical protein
MVYGPRGLSGVSTAGPGVDGMLHIASQFYLDWKKGMLEKVNGKKHTSRCKNLPRQTEIFYLEKVK